MPRTQKVRSLKLHASTGWPHTLLKDVAYEGGSDAEKLLMRRHSVLRPSEPSKFEWSLEKGSVSDFRGLMSKSLHCENDTLGYFYLPAKREGHSGKIRMMKTWENYNDNCPQPAVCE